MAVTSFAVGARPIERERNSNKPSPTAVVAATSVIPKACASTSSHPSAVERRYPESPCRTAPLVASRLVELQRASGLSATGSISMVSS